MNATQYVVSIRHQSGTPFLDPGQVLEGVEQFTVSVKRGFFESSQTGRGLAPDPGAKHGWSSSDNN